jgi:hypothetical protein
MPGRRLWWKLVAVVPDKRVPAAAGEGGWGRWQALGVIASSNSTS